ncbi:regulator of nonsense transcripts 2-like isoform X2 [Ptychodera flava]|uniref:regulator of nonsense transcripts 2-like isoform X2 n=1 Tax=Ptychodera flava TaxID=63121 RepID=UPI003969DB51
MSLNLNADGDPKVDEDKSDVKQVIEQESEDDKTVTQNTEKGQGDDKGIKVPRDEEKTDKQTEKDQEKKGDSATKKKEDTKSQNEKVKGREDKVESCTSMKSFDKDKGRGKQDYREKFKASGDKGYSQSRSDSVHNRRSDRRDYRDLKRGKEGDPGYKSEHNKKEDSRKYAGKDREKGKFEKKDKSKDEAMKEEIKRKELEKLEQQRLQEKKAEEEKRRREEEEELKRAEEEKRRLEEEAAAKMKEEEKKQAKEIESETRERISLKAVLRARNLNAALERPEETFYSKLDSSLKKNTAFIKKLRTMSEQQKDSLSSDFNALNLTKYIGEAVSAVIETKHKMSDISCVVHMCSLLHQRYSEFSPQLLQAFQKALPKKDEKVPDAGKLRVILRLLAELVVYGVFTDKEGLPLLANQISSVTNADKETHSNISLILSFARHCGEDYAGLIPRKNRLLAEKFNVCLPKSEIFSTEVQKSCQNMLRDYYSSLTKHLVQEHKKLQKMERQNRKTLQMKGELNQDMKEETEKAQAAYQKLLVNVSTFSDLLDEDMPDLPEDESARLESGVGIEKFNPYNLTVEFDFETSLWEDEDTKSFYESLINLRAFVPGILFKDSEKNEVTKEETVEELEEEMSKLEVTDTETEDEGTENEIDESGATTDEAVDEEEEKIMEDLEYVAELDVDTEEDDPGSNISMKALLEAFLQKLPTCVNREFIDQAAVDFCMNLNTKANRKKLVKTLFLVPRTRLDLLPFYGRLVAILFPCMPDIARDLVDKLKGDFRWHVRKKDQINLESKIKTVRFIGELTKFSMFPKADTLHCLKMLLHDFSHHNIEMACNLLEACGRFLYRSSDSHLRTNALLELMMRKKSKLHLNERQNTMVENAFFYCNPPDVKQEVKKVRPPMHEYIRKLLYKDLAKLNVEKILRQIRKLPWDDKEISSYTTKCLTAIWNVKYNNIHCAASLLAGLVPYHEEVGIQVVDGVLEEIRLGMEINHPKYNQRRVSVVKYLGELYNYRMVESAVIFKELYSFITFGINLEGIPTPLDPPEHLFRLRLVCTLLDTCGQYFDRGSSKKKLDCFFVYFQRYLWFKKQLDIWNPEIHPFPIDVEYMVSDTLEALRPKLIIPSTAEEAYQAVRDLEQEFLPKIAPFLPLTGNNEEHEDVPHTLTTISECDEATAGHEADGGTDGMPVIAEVEEDTDSDDSDRDIRHLHHTDGDSQSQSQEGTVERDDEETDGMESAGEVEEEDQVTVLTGGPKHITCEEDDDFLAAFDKIMVENLQQRSSEIIKVPQLDVSVPVNVKAKKKTFDQLRIVEEEKTHVDFVMITRRGNKQQYRTVQVPAESSLVTALKNREEAELAEKQKMKQLTLNINERQEEEDYQEMLASMQKPAAANTNREKKTKFQHPKGVPDADLIFKSGGRRW